MVWEGVQGGGPGEVREGSERGSRKMQFLSGIFQIQLRGGDIGAKNCIFEDNIGLRVLKMFVSKNEPLLSLEFFQI